MFAIRVLNFNELFQKTVKSLFSKVNSPYDEGYRNANNVSMAGNTILSRF